MIHLAITFTKFCHIWLHLSTFAFTSPYLIVGFFERTQNGLETRENALASEAVPGMFLIELILTAITIALACQPFTKNLTVAMLPAPRRLCFTRHLSVCRLASSPKNYWSDVHKNFVQVNHVWIRTGSTATEVCTLGALVYMCIARVCTSFLSQLVFSANLLLYASLCGRGWWYVYEPDTDEVRTISSIWLWCTTINSLWNSLTSDIWTASTLVTFRNSLKTYLFFKHSCDITASKSTSSRCRIAPL